MKPLLFLQFFMQLALLTFAMQPFCIAGEDGSPERYIVMRSIDAGGASTIHLNDIPAERRRVTISSAISDPARRLIMLGFRLVTAGEVRIELYDTNGVRRLAQTRAGYSGANHEEIEVAGLPAGSYLLRLSAAEGLAQARILLAR